MTISVLMSVYARECSENLSESLESLCVQTRPAEEVVIVKDGPLKPELDVVIERFRTRLPLVVVALERNVGLGDALRIGVTKCRGELIARMDSDDISVPRRFEVQAETFSKICEVDVVGGNIDEFDSDPSKPIGIRRLPTASAEIHVYAKSRNPMNHVTVMFRREAVLAAGNYQRFSDFEDYHLWTRMLQSGRRFLNIDQVLVHVRVGNGMVGKRGGRKYVRTEIAFQMYLWKTGFVSLGKVVSNVLLRTPVRLAPRTVRQFIYQKLLRA
jgi:glycosyltransferase involved in cell wall biosynthesis